jgi:hypothetical protein
LTSELIFSGERGPLTSELYYAKAFLYSLAAAPSVCGHESGLLLLPRRASTGDAPRGLLFLATSAPRAGLAMTLTFFFASVVPAYFIWLTPSFFNLCLVFLGAFFLTRSTLRLRPGYPPRNGRTSWLCHRGRPYPKSTTFS